MDQFNKVFNFTPSRSQIPVHSVVGCAMVHSSQLMMIRYNYWFFFWRKIFIFWIWKSTSICMKLLIVRAAKKSRLNFSNILGGVKFFLSPCFKKKIKQLTHHRDLKLSKIQPFLQTGPPHIFISNTWEDSIAENTIRWSSQNSTLV